MAWDCNNLLPIIIEMARGRKLTRRARRGTRKGSRKGTRRQRGGQNAAAVAPAAPVIANLYLYKFVTPTAAPGAALAGRTLTRPPSTAATNVTVISSDNNLVTATGTVNNATIKLDKSLGNLTDWDVKVYKNGSWIPALNLDSSSGVRMESDAKLVRKPTALRFGSMNRKLPLSLTSLVLQGIGGTSAGISAEKDANGANILVTLKFSKV